MNLFWLLLLSLVCALTATAPNTPRLFKLVDSYLAQKVKLRCYLKPKEHKRHFIMPPQYGKTYKEFFPFTEGEFVFYAKATSDIYVGLTDGLKKGANLMEILLGGWGNTQSAIRIKKLGQQHGRLSAKHRGTACNPEFGYWHGIRYKKKNVPGRDYWIRYKDGVINVGISKIPGHNLILQFKDPNPFAPKYIAFSTFHKQLLTALQQMLLELQN